MTDAARPRRPTGELILSLRGISQELRRGLGADRHRPRRPRRRGRGAGRRQRRRQVDAGQDPRRRAPADLRRRSTSRASRSTHDRARATRSTSASPRSSRTSRSARTSTSSPTSSSARSSSPWQLDEVAMEVRAWTLLNELAARIPSVREPIASLSGGQRQTVAIARSLLLDPKIIMLDEPTAALGVAQTAEVLNLIERLRDRGLGVIMISHNMEDVRAVADRIVVLRLGRNNGIFTPGRLERTSSSAPSPAPPTTRSRAAPRAARPNARGGPAMSRQPTRRRCSTAATRASRHDEGVGGAVRGFLDRVRSGDLGSLPVIVGLVIIWTVFYQPQPDLPVAEQPGEPALRLLDGRRHLARHRLRADARRDRPLGRLDERRRLGAARRALGEPGLAGARRRSLAALARRRGDRRDLRAALQPARHAELRLDAGRACSRSSACSSTCSAPPARSTCPTARRSCSFGQLLVMPAWLSHGLALHPGRRHARRRALRTMRAAAAANLSPRLARRPDRQGGGADRRRCSSSSATSTSAAACRGCSASSCCWSSS